MRIGIDARPLGTHRTGIGNYVRGLLDQLSEIAPEHKYFLYSNRAIDSPGCGVGIQQRIDHAFRFIPGSFWHLGRAGIHTKRDRLDVFWSTFPILPFRMPSRLLTIATVYDLVWVRFPETMTKYNLLVHQLCAKRAITNADLIVVISRSTRDELIKTFGVPEGRVRLVYPGVSERYKPMDSLDAAAYISTKYGVPKSYMAAVGTIEPRKNLSLLVCALRILKSSGQLNCPLLIVGGNGWKNSHIWREIHAAELTDDIRFLGYLPDEDLPYFYGGAQLFLFPSLYEGFGFPPVEAMACGTPVIASDAQCMPEVLGSVAILEPASSPERFATAIIRVLSNQSLRDQMKEQGIRRAQNYTWAKSARQLSQVMESLVKGGRSECRSNVLA